MGGLGNQLFQWAYGKYLSTKYNTPLYLDLLVYKNQVGMTKRSFSLDKFPNLTYNIKPVEKVKTLKLVDNFKFSELKYSKDSDYFLEGYWQSEKYFKAVEEVIKRELLPDAETNSKLNKLILEYKNIVSLHIRRTDYVKLKGYHPVQPIAYYQKALNTIGDYDQIFVFSDDIQWCKNNLEFNNMTFVEGLGDVEDLWLQTMCSHNIIANSSFSWWGAWLNTHPDKKVVAPKNWFGKKLQLSSQDIIPETWIKI